MTSVFDRLSKAETASSKRRKGRGKSEGELDDVLESEGGGANRPKSKGAVNSAVFDRLTKSETASTAKKRVSPMKVSQIRERNKNNSSSSRFVVSMRISPIIESAEAVPRLGRRSTKTSGEESVSSRKQKTTTATSSDRRDFFDRLASTETASSAAFKNTSGDQKDSTGTDSTGRSSVISAERQAFYDRLMNAETQQSARFKKATSDAQETPSPTSPKKSGTLSQKQRAIIDRLASTETKSSRLKALGPKTSEPKTSASKPNMLAAGPKTSAPGPKTQSGKSERSGAGVSSSSKRQHGSVRKADSSSSLFDRLSSHETASFRARRLAAQKTPTKPTSPTKTAMNRSPVRPSQRKNMPKPVTPADSSPSEVKERSAGEEKEDPVDLVADGEVIPTVSTMDEQLLESVLTADDEVDMSKSFGDQPSLESILGTSGHSVKLYITDARLSGTEDAGCSDEEEKKSNGCTSFRALSPTELGLDDTLASYEKGKLTTRHVANYIVDALFMKDFLGNNTSDNWEIKDPVAKELVHTEGEDDLAVSPLMKEAYSTWAVEKLAQRNHSDIRSVATGKALIHFPFPGETEDGDVLKIENYSYDVSVP